MSNTINLQPAEPRRLRRDTVEQKRALPFHVAMGILAGGASVVCCEGSTEDVLRPSRRHAVEQ